MPTAMCQVCARRKQARGHFGACRSSKCLEAIQKRAFTMQNVDVTTDKRDPAVGMGPVKVNGRGKFEVKRSVTVKGVHCLLLKDGTTHPVKNCEEI